LLKKDDRPNPIKESYLIRRDESPTNSSYLSKKDDFKKAVDPHVVKKDEQP